MYKDKLKDEINFLKSLRTHHVYGELEVPTEEENDLVEQLYQIEKAEETERNKYCRDFSVEVDGY